MRTLDDRPLWGLWLLGLLMAAWVAQIADFQPNDVESGVAIQTPQIEPSRLLDEDYYADVDDWIESEFALRGAGLRAKAAVDYDLFGDSPVPDRVVSGDDDWLFLAEYLNPSCEEVESLHPPVSSLAAPDALFVVTAPKAAYHPDALDEAEQECLAAARDRQLAAFAGQTVDIDGELRFLRDSGIDAFLRDDTHWSMEARLVVARAIVESVGSGLWDDGAVSMGEVERLSDLARIIGIKRGGPVEGPLVSLPIEVTAQQTVALNGDLTVIQTSVADHAQVVPGVTYLIGDSQMSYVLPLLAPYFEDLRFVNWFVIEGFGFPANSWPDPDRVLVQTVELGAAKRLESPDLMSYLARLD